MQIACRRLNATVEIVVDDDGPGIRPEAIEKIFERFYTDRPQQNFGQNSGLGLSISKQIVEVHGGRLMAQNRVSATDENSEPRVSAPDSSCNCRRRSLAANGGRTYHSRFGRVDRRRRAARSRTGRFGQVPPRPQIDPGGNGWAADVCTPGGGRPALPAPRQRAIAGVPAEQLAGLIEVRGSDSLPAS